MRRWLPGALMLAAAMLLAALGVWQVERLAWKRALIAQVDARLAAPARPPEAGLWRRATPDDAYRRLRLRGRWLAVRPVFVQAVTDYGPGYWMLSPLRTDRGTVLVNRGFVADRTVPPPRGGAVVSGLLRLPEPGGAFLRSNDAAADRWFSRDPAAIAAARDLGRVAPFFVDADRASSPGSPRGGLTVVRFANNHLVYALTWFGLAALALWGAWRFAQPETRGRR